jgi:hypothetical protein
MLPNGFPEFHALTIPCSFFLVFVSALKMILAGPRTGSRGRRLA